MRKLGQKSTCVRSERLERSEGDAKHRRGGVGEGLSAARPSLAPTVGFILVAICARIAIGVTQEYGSGGIFTWVFRGLERQR